jgi:hypothetical protein
MRADLPDAIEITRKVDPKEDFKKRGKQVRCVRVNTGCSRVCWHA